MRTITAPGVEIKEIDKSQYSPAMVGTTCYVMGFANKGEAYRPMEFTSRAAWTTYYGEPDNEAERYFYNACTEVLNQNGRLYCARLPYDNEAFEKMVGFRYSISDSSTAIADINNLFKGVDNYSYLEALSSLDSTIDRAITIQPKLNPELIEADDVQLYIGDEKKVTNNTFLIIDKTCSPYKKIQEDNRKGKKRELLGIVPVVTTAVNGMYAQKLITVENRFAKYYESIGKIKTLNDETGGIEQSDVFSSKDNTNNPLAINTDLVKQLNSAYKGYQIKVVQLTDEYETINDINESLNDLLKQGLINNNNTIEETIELDSSVGDWITKINDSIEQLSLYWKDSEDLSSLIESEALGDQIIDNADANELTIGEINQKVKKLQSYFNVVAEYHSEDGDDSLPSTVSLEANTFFPTIGFDPETSTVDRENLKKICVTVYKMYMDPSEGNKISFEAVEAFAGSLCKDDKDPNTGTTTFIDTIINNQSNYIYFFSNCFSTKTAKSEYYGEKEGSEVDILIVQPTHTCGSLGYYSEQVKENISINKSIFEGINKCFEKVSDINQLDIDIIPDAGIANIASFIKAVYGDVPGEYDLNAVDSNGNPLIVNWKVDKMNDAIKIWKTVEQKYDTFCKSVRKDCMFIADGLRPMVIQGQKKIVRPTNPKNTIDVNILPYVKLQTGLNTNYGAGYMDWFEIADEYTGNFFWCPPSIKAMGCYIYTDVNFNYWDAPAGLTRGIIQAVDVAFSPTPAQAGSIYEKNWNYAINYPNDGIILEGQKTFQVKPSAFDRVNVRRLFLRLERAAYKVARYFVYEGNTAYTRQRLVDALDPYFKEAKVGGGVYDYLIRCDEKNNTPEVIDRNELRVQIGIKPVKTAEYILIDFIALSTGGSFEEAMG